MNNFGFNGSITSGGLNNENPLMQYLKQYMPPQQSDSEPVARPTISNGIASFEISSKSDIEYIEPDKSGRKQLYICEPENKIYLGRYNHVRREMDYRAYVDEGETRLFQKQDTGADMSQIAEALMAVVNKLEAMHTEIQELKNAEPPKPGTVRGANGRFQKKGEGNA